MKSHFDELAKDLARGVSRREALGRFGIGLAALATGVLLGRRTARAQTGCPSAEEVAACQKEARRERAACGRACGSLRKEERAACVAACEAQYQQALAACEVCGECTNPQMGCTGFSPCPGTECGCFQTAEGSTVCAQPGFCDTSCTSSSECEDGFVCVVNSCCFGGAGVCIARCGTTAPTALRGDGPTTSILPLQN